MYYGIIHVNNFNTILLIHLQILGYFITKKLSQKTIFNDIYFIYIHNNKNYIMRLDSQFIHHIHIVLWYKTCKQFQYYSSYPSPNFRLVHYYTSFFLHKPKPNDS